MYKILPPTRFVCLRTVYYYYYYYTLVFNSSILDLYCDIVIDYIYKFTLSEIVRWLSDNI